MPFTSRTLSVSIDRDWHEVYAFASDPMNLHHWAPGLGQDFVQDGADWVFRDPEGRPVRLRFSPQNAFGILDHDVMLGDQVVHIAMRVVPNGDGAELTFLLLQTPDLSDADFARDAATVLSDLERLKALLGAGPD